MSIERDGAAQPAGRDAWALDGFAPLPGDVVQLPGDERQTVATVYLCAEQDGPLTIRWSWVVLEDGRLVEVAPRGCALYGAPTVLAQGSGPFLDLVAQDGALVRFEERVRAGSWVRRPVRLLLHGQRWRVTATGTVMARRLGPVPANGWEQIGAARATDAPDVYFTLAGLKDTDALGLGVWAADICLAFGRRLGSSPSAVGLRVVSEEQLR